MDLPSFTYAFFNIAEGILWIGLSVYLVANLKVLKQDKLFWVYLSIPCFLIFSVTDFLEAPKFGKKLPHWLLALKLASGAIIFLSRLVYLGTKEIKKSLQTIALGLALLAVGLFYFFKV